MPNSLPTVPARRNRLATVPAASASARTATPSLTYSVLEAAQALGVSESTIKRMIQRDELRSIKAGRRRLVPKQAIEEVLAN
ncbi:helix-turn-helix domain-containing protein [Rhodopirellula sp. JC740]|uniref:Helix-turn-helix domain-containing protein n=1 Tax=Rhodopirellula halodulae TaxID=2894198 RepID=A0ABS8NJQ8_9BACT|nr:helix-turn-helix domain-containing protein [Rhodopirellula sp. JC740]